MLVEQMSAAGIAALLVRLCWWLRGEMHALLCAAATSCAHTAPCTCPAHVPLCPYV